MRLLSALSLVALLVVVVGCSPAAPPAPTAAAPQVKANLNQVMRGILFPNSNIIFDAQDTDPGAPPDPAAAGSSPYAGTYGGWEAVENASMALAEAANLISLPGRVCHNNKPVPLDDPVYQKGLAALREVAQLSYETAKAKKSCRRHAGRGRQGHAGVRDLPRRVPRPGCGRQAHWHGGPLHQGLTGWPGALRPGPAFTRGSMS